MAGEDYRPVEGGSADELFALGLTEHVHGYVMPPANPPVSESPWAAECAKVKTLSDDLLNKEVAVEAKADLVVAGWNSGFKDERIHPRRPRGHQRPPEHRRAGEVRDLPARTQPLSRRAAQPARPA